MRLGLIAAIVFMASGCGSDATSWLALLGLVTPVANDGANCHDQIGDANGDGTIDTRDCIGPRGPAGEPGLPGERGPSGFDGRDGFDGADRGDLELPKRGTMCHCTPGGQCLTLNLSPAGAAAHLRDHGGDSPGPCAGDADVAKLMTSARVGENTCNASYGDNIEACLVYHDGTGLIIKYVRPMANSWYSVGGVDARVDVWIFDAHVGDDRFAIPIRSHVPGDELGVGIAFTPGYAAVRIVGELRNIEDVVYAE